MILDEDEQPQSRQEQPKPINSDKSNTDRGKQTESKHKIVSQIAQKLSVAFQEAHVFCTTFMTPKKKQLTITKQINRKSVYRGANKVADRVKIDNKIAREERQEQKQVELIKNKQKISNNKHTSKESHRQTEKSNEIESRKPSSGGKQVKSKIQTSVEKNRQFENSHMGMGPYYCFLHRTKNKERQKPEIGVMDVKEFMDYMESRWHAMDLQQQSKYVETYRNSKSFQDKIERILNQKNMKSPINQKIEKMIEKKKEKAGRFDFTNMKESLKRVQKTLKSQDSSIISGGLGLGNIPNLTYHRKIDIDAIDLDPQEQEKNKPRKMPHTF